MTKPTNLDFKFLIENIEEHKKCLKIDNGSYAIGTKSKKAVSEFERIIKEKLGKGKSDIFITYTNSNGKDVDNNALKKVPIQSLRNIHTVLSWLFSEEYTPSHTIEHVKRYLANLNVPEGEKEIETTRSFTKFIEIIRPFLSNEFKAYDYKLNPKTWVFDVSEIKTDTSQPTPFFQINDPISLKSIIISKSSKNKRKKILEKVKSFKSQFTDVGLDISNEDTISLNKKISDSTTFSEANFNITLCYLFAKITIEKVVPQTYFEKFYDSIIVHKYPMSVKKQKKYNIIINKIIQEDDFFSELGLKMTTDWKLTSKNIDSSSSNYKKLKISGVFLLGICFAVFLIHSIFFTNTDIKQKIENDISNTQHCLFTPDVNKHQILILPLSNIESKDIKNTPSYFIKKRLEELNQLDSLNMEIAFCRDFKVDEIDDPKYFKKIKAKYKANHIIYGFYTNDFKVQENNNKICLNYITDYKEYGNAVPNSFIKNDFKDYKYASLKDISKGSLQQGLDFLVYWNAALAALSNKKYDKAIKYSNKLLKLTNEDLDLVYLSLGYAYDNLQKIELALPYYLKVATGNSKYAAEAYTRMGMIYLTFDKASKAKICFENALTLNKNKKVYLSLYNTNIITNKAKENIHLMRKAISYFPKDYMLKYYLALAYKKQGYFQNFKRDSTLIANNFGAEKLKGKDLSKNLIKFYLNGVRDYKVMKIYDRISLAFSQKEHYSQRVDSMYTDFCRITNFAPKYFEEKGQGLYFIYRGKDIIGGTHFEKIKGSQNRSIAKKTTKTPNIWPNIKIKKITNPKG